jgi:hypothetical protein
MSGNKINNFTAVSKEITSLNKKVRALFCALENMPPSNGSIPVVPTYADLPPAEDNYGVIYAVTQSTGVSWLPQWAGGTFKPKGYYYSDGSTWVYLGEFPTNATQQEVNDGIINTKFVSPQTLKGWWDQLTVTISDIQGLQAELDSKPNAALTAFDIDKIELELKLPADSFYRYKVFTYLNGELSQITTYTNQSMTGLLFTQQFIYSSGNLTSQIVTRNTDNFQYTKVYNYDINGNLTTINYS